MLLLGFNLLEVSFFLFHEFLAQPPYAVTQHEDQRQNHKNGADFAPHSWMPTASYPSNLCVCPLLGCVCEFVSLRNPACADVPCPAPEMVLSFSRLKTRCLAHALLYTHVLVQKRELWP